MLELLAQNQIARISLLVLLFSFKLKWLPNVGYTPFSEDPSHRRRLEMIAAYEADGSLPDLPA